MNFNRLVETFIPIDLPADKASTDGWYHCMDTIRLLALPLLDSKRKEIGWYSFLLHYKEITAFRVMLCVHIRMELRPKVNMRTFIAQLPDFCRCSSRFRIRASDPVLGIDKNALHDGDIEVVWKVLGESSRLVAHILRTNGPDRPTSIQNVYQFLHFIGNQLCVTGLGIKMP